jgi:phospholipid/cholesterol/gamma-HCH transport system permease protein
VNELWERVKDAIRQLGDYGLFSIHITTALFKRPPRYVDVIEHMDALGVQSLVILIATGLFIGMAITMLLQAEMAMYGAKVYIGRMLGVATVRELGPVIAGLMLSGRVGARIASELGSMTVTQQIDSVEGLGQDPIQKLVAPRVVALFIAVPACTMVTDLVIMLGGFLISSVSPATFWFEARKAFTLRHLSGGMLKPFIFGIIIATVSCYIGMKARNGVRGVGQAAANAVVTSSVAIFLANYFIGFVVLKAFGV